MSLKAFHIFFIACSALLALGLGVYCLSRFVTGGRALDMVLAIAGLAAGVLLVVYGVSFLRKLRNVGMMAVICLLVPHIASACPVCYGDPASPQTKGMQAAIFFLLGVTGLMMAGFISLFVYFWRRGRRLAIEQTVLVRQMMEASQK